MKFAWQIFIYFDYFFGEKNEKDFKSFSFGNVGFDSI